MIPSEAPPIKALIFDFDGLILDTETAIYEAWRQIYTDNGFELSIETWSQCVGSDFGHYNPATDLENLLGRTLDWEVLKYQRRAYVNQTLEKSQPMPGVHALLERAREQGIPCAVASSSTIEWVGGWLEKLNLRQYFSHVTTLDDTGKVKPDPSLFLLSAERMGVDPANIVVLEDSLNGLRGATAAGMRCVVVPCAITRHLQFSNAWLQITSLEEFCPWNNPAIAEVLP